MQIRVIRGQTHSNPAAEIQIHESPESPTNNRSTCGFQNQISATKSPDSCKFVSFVDKPPATPAQELTTTNHPNHQRIIAAPAVSKIKSAQPSPLIRANSCHSWTNTQQPRRRNSQPRITRITQRIIAGPAVSKIKSAQPSPLIRANSCHSWSITQQPRHRNSQPRITRITQRIIAGPAVSKIKSEQPGPLIRANSCDSWTIAPLPHLTLRQPGPFAQASHRAPQPIRRQSQAIGSATTESRDFSSCPAIPPGHHRDH